VIPAVNGSVQTTGERVVVPAHGTTYDGDARVFAVLEDRLRRLPGFDAFRLTPSDDPAFLVARRVDDLVPGGYRLDVRADRIAIHSSDDEGLANALTTLYWRIREGGGDLAGETVVDAPEKPYRGFLLDCSRRFFDLDTVTGLIEQAALRKLNRFHWHLSDDQGYRIESTRFPALNEVGSWRTEMDGSRYGGFYTRDQIRDVIAFAAARGVEVIPELDLPGHVTAIIAAHPEVSCSGEPAEVVTMPGIHARILCAGKDDAIAFAKDLLDEVCEIFPSRVIHTGGDEAPKTEWEACPDCQRRLRDEGLSDFEQLQAWFTAQIIDHLAAKGRTAVCWNESLKSGTLDDRAIVQYWYEEPGAYADGAIGQDRRYIYSESKELYFDYSPAMLPLRHVLNSRPRTADGTEFAEDSVLGFEAALWSEQIYDRTRLEQLAFPRLLAVSERAWRGATDYDDFLTRCEREIQHLDSDGVAHYPLAESDLAGEPQRQAIVADWKPKIDLVRQFGQGAFVDAILGIVRERMEGEFGDDDIELTLQELKA
jgi:hexosaminidase